MLMSCNSTDCYSPYCLESGFWRGKSLRGDSEQKQSPGPGGPVHFQLLSGTHHFSGGMGIPELYCRLLQHHSGHLWHGLIKTWGCDPPPVSCPCAPWPRNADTWLTGLTECTGRDTQFPNTFLKDTIFHVRNVAMILKDSPSELKGRHSVFRYLPKYYK